MKATAKTCSLINGARQRTRWAGIMIVLLCGWSLAVAAGTRAVWQFDSTAGQEASAGFTWPAQLPISPAADRPTLILILHPNCGCSRASLKELNALVSAYPNRLRPIIVFDRPTGLTADPATSDLPTLAAAIPEATVVSDTGSIAAEMGARTSGQVFVFDPDGTLRFSGGITESRGHVGDNDGVRVIRAILDQTINSTSLLRSTPVFGCSLR